MSAFIQSIKNKIDKKEEEFIKLSMDKTQAKLIEIFGEQAMNNFIRDERCFILRDSERKLLGLIISVDESCIIIDEIVKAKNGYLWKNSSANSGYKIEKEEDLYYAAKYFNII